MLWQGNNRAYARRIAVALVACFGLLALSPAVGLADEAEVVYDPSTVSVIEVDLPQASKEALEADPEGEYQPATLTFKRTDGTPGGIVETIGPKEVEMRLKGSASFRDLSGKAAFKIKFPKASPLLGLRKMTLNNMIEDPSMTHETLAYTLHRALGVPASRTGFVYLEINGEHFGLYLDVENYDKVAMKKKLGGFDDEVQHVYEGEDGADLEPGLLGNFEVDEGPDDDISDLEELAAAVTDPSPDPWSTAVGAHADLEEMTRMWAAEKYSGQFDGYAGGPALDHPNNYYLATGTDGLFRMLPWGQDETWKGENHLPFDGEAGVMFEGCLADPGCDAVYEEALENLQTTVPLLKLDALAVCTAEMLAPWQQLEEDESTRFEYDGAEIAEAVAETRAFIAGRPGELADFLGNTGPTQPAPVDSCPTEEAEEPEVPLVTYRVQMPPPTEQGVAPRAGTLGSIARKGKRLRVSLFLPVAGSLKLTAKTAGRQGSLACRRRATRAAGSATISCRLSGAAVKALKDGPLRLVISVGIPGDPEPLTRLVRLPRL